MPCPTSDHFLCAGNRPKQFTQLLSVGFDKCSLVLGCSIHHSGSEAAHAQKFQNQNRTFCATMQQLCCILEKNNKQPHQWNIFM